MKNVVIFAVGDKNHQRVLKQLKSLSPIEVNGKYKNQLEKSIAVDIQFTDAMKKVADFFEQESILLVDEVGMARLLFNDGSLMKIGKIKQVDKREALKKDSYSEVNGKYFITE